MAIKITSSVDANRLMGVIKKAVRKWAHMRFGDEFAEEFVNDYVVFETWHHENGYLIFEVRGEWDYDDEYPLVHDYLNPAVEFFFGNNWYYFEPYTMNVLQLAIPDEEIHGAARRVGRVFDEPPGFSDAERRIYWYELDENQRADVYYGGWNVVWDKLTDSQRKAIEDSWLGDAKRANRRVSVSLEDSLRGILNDIDADGIGSQVRDYVDERIGLGADLIATSEKYGVDPERLRELKERVSDWYERIYDSYDNVPGYQEAIDAGDALIRSHAPYVDALIEYRGDMLSSDREVAALAFAMDELGLASGGSAYGSRKLVRKAFSGGTYNVTYGEGFETHSMRGVGVERVADFLEQEARFLRMNTPGRDYLMTIQIQRVD